MVLPAIVKEVPTEARLPNPVTEVRFGLLFIVKAAPTFDKEVNPDKEDAGMPEKSKLPPTLVNDGSTLVKLVAVFPVMERLPRMVVTLFNPE